MARTEVRIPLSLWREDKFLSMPMSAQHVLMLLNCQADLDISGLIVLRPRRWSNRTPDLTTDHIFPNSRGGLFAIENLQTLCGPCNARKGNRI